MEPKNKCGITRMITTTRLQSLSRDGVAQTQQLQKQINGRLTSGNKSSLRGRGHKPGAGKLLIQQGG